MMASELHFHLDTILQNLGEDYAILKYNLSPTTAASASPLKKKKSATGQISNANNAFL